MEQLTLEAKLVLFKWKQYESAIILLTVRWYLKYSLSYRDVVEMMSERGLKISKYLYRAVDSRGKTIDFMLSENRDMQAAKRFFTKALSSPHNQIPRVITLDKNPAYPPAIQELINEKFLPKDTLIRQTKYLNNIVEQDHRFIKKLQNRCLVLKRFYLQNGR